MNEYNLNENKLKVLLTVSRLYLQAVRVMCVIFANQLLICDEVPPTLVLKAHPVI